MNKPTNPYRQDLRKKILATAMAAFREKGVKAVKMDDIASQLSISKRTLYELYDNKEDLLYACVLDHDQTFEKRLKAMMEDGENTVIDVLICFMRMHIEESSKTNPAFFTEVAKYPKLIAYIDERKAKSRSRSIGFMMKGVEEGFFRSDVNYNVTNLMADVFINYVMKHELYKQIPLHEIFRNVIMVMLRGFCTEKGLQRIDQLNLWSEIGQQE